MDLYEPQRHEVTSGADWNEAVARTAIVRIAADAHRVFSTERLWPIHPFDVSPERPAAMKPLYYGAAGVIWALDYLVRRGGIDAGPDYAATAADLTERHHDDLRANAAADGYLGGELASYLIGDAGMLMLSWKLQPSDEVAAQIYSLLQQKVGDTRGVLWGAAGSMVAALLMHTMSGEARWAELFTRHFEALWDRWTWVDAPGCWVWVAEVYGDTQTRLGALHGFVANAYAMVRGAHLLPIERRDAALDRIEQTLQRTALREGGVVNWPHTVGAFNRAEPMPVLVQFCSGAPGIVACMAGLDAGGSRPSIDALLVDAGELVWRAGPTTKFPVLCHGAVGAGYAFLKLYARTGDARWLARARAFAMHGIDRSQRALEQYGQRKYSLWTGDLGLAVYIWDCVQGTAQLPTLDVF